MTLTSKKRIEYAAYAITSDFERELWKYQPSELEPEGVIEEALVTSNCRVFEQLTITMPELTYDEIRAAGEVALTDYHRIIETALEERSGAAQ